VEVREGVEEKARECGEKWRKRIVKEIEKKEIEIRSY